IAADRHVDDEDAERNADLRRRQPDPWRGIHRVDHVADKRVDVRCEPADLRGFLVQRAGAVFENWSNHRSDDIKPRAAEPAENKLLWKSIHYTFQPVSGQPRDVEI